MSHAAAPNLLRELEEYLHEHIPISAAMGVAVAGIGADHVRLSAPLEPNINHRSTVFGGSAAAVAILAGWSFLHLRIGHSGRGDRIVIQRNFIDYTRPIDDDFEALALAPEPAEWRRFQRTLARRGIARVDLRIQLLCRGQEVGEGVGTYVVLPVPSEEDAG